MTQANQTKTPSADGNLNPKQNPFAHSAAQRDFRVLIDSIPDYAILMLDLEGRILTWNNGARNIHGYDDNEILGSHVSRFYIPASTPGFNLKPEETGSAKVKYELDEASTKGRFEEEGWRVRKNGKLFWANVVITPLKDESGHVYGFTKVTRDLTERMHAEKALRESEEKLRLMVASVKDYAIIMLDPEGNIVSWNAGAERIKGWTEKEIVGRSFKNFYPKEDLEAGKTEMELEVAERVGTFEDYGWRVRKDGSRFWANVVITALKDEHGRLRGFSKVTRDITERKIAEEELKKAYDELEAFSYSVSHDLRAPLRSMDGFSDILEELLDDKLDDKTRGYLRRIRESSQKMSRLIDDLLNLSRLGRAQIKVEPVNVTEMVEKLVAEQKKDQPNRNVEVIVHQGMTADADPSLLRIVLENLISNAWKYTSKKETAKVEIGCINEHAEATYFVKDNGAGFDMRYGDKLFGAFQRLHRVDEFPGNGIGLATVKRIIHRHGGAVRAESEPTKGATFYFSLPLISRKGGA